MKLQRLITVAMLAIATPVFASWKPAAYDLTGTISFESQHADAESHITVDGKTYDSYCSFEGTSANCTDTGGVFVVTFANGNSMAFYSSSNDSPYSHCDWGKTTCEPLLALMSDGKRGPHKFQYRTVKTVKEGRPMFCVGFDIKDKHGKPKPQERCYGIMFLDQP
jgi:hypothetical protein